VRLFFAIFAFFAFFVAAATVADAGSDMRSLVEIERAVQSDPENLQLAAEYRQLAIPARDFDRPIGVLEKLAKQKGSGPNVQISLALAYVDKVPTSGDIRRLYLGRDAIGALTRAIAQQPTPLARSDQPVLQQLHLSPRAARDRGPRAGAGDDDRRLAAGADPARAHGARRRIFQARQLRQSA
jgi:hypothetical protein